MPRPRIDPYWQDRIYALTAQRPGASSAQIRLALAGEWRSMEEPQRSSVGPPPAPKTIRSYAVRFVKELTEEEKRSYRLVSWPESFEVGDLPWEAVPVFFELLRWNQNISPPRPDPGLDVASPEALKWAQEQSERRWDLVEKGVKNRPPVRLARWLYRVTQAAPDGPFDWRLETASRLAAAEAVGASDLREQINGAVESRVVAEAYVSILVRFPEPEPEKED